MRNQRRTKRAAGEFRLHRQFNDTRRCELVGERQILEVISLGAPLAGILNKLCMIIDIRIGDVVSIVSLAEADEDHFGSVTQRALQVGLEMFSCSAILGCDGTFLGALEIYGCELRRPTPLEDHLIQQVVHLAAKALQSQEIGNEFEGYARTERPDCALARKTSIYQLILRRAVLTRRTERKHRDRAKKPNMYNEFFALRENPFNVNPDPRYLFLTPPIQEALSNLTRGIESRKGLILLTGEAGTGKTTLLNRLLDWLHERRTPTAFIFNSHLEISHLFDFVLADFGVKFDPRLKDNALMRLHQWLTERYRAGDTPVLIVDEAQGLRNHVLEEIRMLLNLETASEKLLQIVLAGQPELEERFQQLELRHIKQRIALRCKTAALTSAETRDYIQARLQIAGAGGQQIFAPPAMDAVHFYSGGIPRVMNLLCEHALINASVERIRPVPVQFVAEVAREFQFDGIKPVGPAFVSSDGLDSDATPVQSRFMNALVSLTASDGPLCPQWADASTIAGSGRFADADKVSTPVTRPAPPVLDSQTFPEVAGDAESSRPPSDSLAAPAAPWLAQLEARLLSDWTTFFSEVGSSVASESAANRAPAAQGPRLHLVEAKGVLGVSPASSRGQVSNRQAPPRPPSRAVARKSVPPSSSLTKLTRLRVRLVRWRGKLSEGFSSSVKSSGEARTRATLIQLPERWLHAVRARYWECLAWGDRGMNIAGSIDWPRLRRSAFQWLREPCDPTRWRLSDSRLFGELLRINHKKM